MDDQEMDKKDIIKESSDNKNNQKVASIKKGVIVAVVIIVASLAYVNKGLFIAASVNGDLISRFSVISELEKTSGKVALESLITHSLISKEAEKNFVVAGKEEVDAEITDIENQIAIQGMTLDEALEAQGMTRESFERQILTQKKLEKLLGDKIQVSDEEVAQYITDNQITVPEGQEQEYYDGIKNQMEQQKFSTEAGVLIDSLKSQAKINYFVEY